MTPSNQAFETRENVRLTKSVVGEKVQVKASGGVQTVSDCVGTMETGAERIWHEQRGGDYGRKRMLYGVFLEFFAGRDL